MLLVEISDLAALFRVLIQHDEASSHSLDLCPGKVVRRSQRVPSAVPEVSRVHGLAGSCISLAALASESCIPLGFSLILHDLGELLLFDQHLADVLHF